MENVRKSFDFLEFNLFIINYQNHWWNLYILKDWQLFPKIQLQWKFVIYLNLIHFLKKLYNYITLIEKLVLNQSFSTPITITLQIFKNLSKYCKSVYQHFIKLYSLNLHLPITQLAVFFEFFLHKIKFIDLIYFGISLHHNLLDFLKLIHYFQNFSNFHLILHLTSYQYQKIKCWFCFELKPLKVFLNFYCFFYEIFTFKISDCLIYFLQKQTNFWKNLCINFKDFFLFLIILII